MLRTLDNVLPTHQRPLPRPSNPLCSSPKWLNAYNKDYTVPDTFPQTNQIANLAQNKFIAPFDNRVPRGVEIFLQQSGKFRTQSSTVENEQKGSGNLLVPGGECKKRLPNSEAVPVGVASRGMGAAPAFEEVGEKPDIGIKDTGLEILEVVQFDTREACKETVFTQGGGHERNID